MDATTYIDLDAQREIIRSNLTQIASNIGMMMRDAGLHFPIYISVRDSGDSLATFATPLDPSDDDWHQASDIVCRIMEEKIGGDTKLRNRGLLCAVANAAPMGAAEVTPDRSGPPTRQTLSTAEIR